jgi:hypothetical protein
MLKRDWGKQLTNEGKYPHSPDRLLLGTDSVSFDQVNYSDAQTGAAIGAHSARALLALRLANNRHQFPLPIAARPKPHSPFSNRAGPSHSTGAGVSALRG